MSAIFRLLSNYELLLVLARFCSTLFLFAFSWNARMPHGMDLTLLWSCAYYLLSSALLAALMRVGEWRWRAWNGVVVLDLLIITWLVYTHGGLRTDLYYFYYQALAMACFLHRWQKALAFSVVTCLLYTVGLVYAPGDGTRALVLRTVLFALTSLTFPMLSLVDFQRRDSYQQFTQMLEEKEKLMREMDLINQQIAEYTLDLHSRAVLDQLTRLHNHNYFHQRLLVEVEKAKQERTTLSLLLFDIDNFKKVNDTYGHTFGDQVLVAITSRLQDLLHGTYHISARVGGEELAVVMPDTSLGEAFDYAEGLRQEIAKVNVPLPTGAPFHVTVSVGVAAFPDTASDHQQLIDCADQAMYKAKKEGKNRVCLYETIL